jgi:hypothetical protein
VQIPFAERAFIDMRKLEDYCLDPTHPVGRDKAVVFRSALGFTAADAPALRDLILRAASTEEARLGRLDEFGQRYVIDFQASTSFRSARLRAAWIIRSDEDFPRLTTCFVLPE